MINPVFPDGGTRHFRYPYRYNHFHKPLHDRYDFLYPGAGPATGPLPNRRLVQQRPIPGLCMRCIPFYPTLNKPAKPMKAMDKIPAIIKFKAVPSINLGIFNLENSSRLCLGVVHSEIHEITAWNYVR